MLKPDYKALWPTMQIDSKSVNNIKLAAQSVTKFKDRYTAVGVQVCPSSPIPWYFIGVIHRMESGQNFNRHLHNGDPLTARTVQVPKGRPVFGNPPFTWEESAQDALKLMGYNSPKVWDIDDVLNRLEDYNGHGYWAHDIYSPYIWSRTNHYTKGKFTSDGHFNPNNVSIQIGCAPILSFLLNINNNITLY